MSGFITNQAKRKGYFAPDKHARERLDYQLPDIAHISISEWAFCTAAYAVQVDHPQDQVQPNQIEGPTVYGGNRWVPVPFAYQTSITGYDVLNKFTNNSDTDIAYADNPCIRTIMPLNVLWSPYVRRLVADTPYDSKYTGFTERIWPLGMASLFNRYHYIRVRKCKVTLQFTNWSRDSFAGYVAVNRRDVDPDGISSSNMGDDHLPGFAPKGMYNTVTFNIRGAENSTNFNPANPDEYHATGNTFAKPSVSYFEFEVDVPRLCADLEWKYDAMQKYDSQSNFWYDFVKSDTATFIRPNVECYYQIMLNRKYHGEDSTGVPGPLVAIRHTWQVELGRNDSADGITSTIGYTVRT